MKLKLIIIKPVFTDSFIPPPTDEQLWNIFHTLDYAARNDPFVNYDSMIMRGYRLISPHERYYYEETIKRGHYNSPYAKNDRLWILISSDCNQRHLDFQQQRQNLKYNHRDDNKYQDNNHDEESQSQIYSLKRKAIEANNLTLTNSSNIPTYAQEISDEDTIGKYEW